MPRNIRRFCTLLCLASAFPLLLSSCVGPCGIVWPWSGSGKVPNVTSSPLTSANYAPAETIYRTFLPGGNWPGAKTNFIYSLSFGQIDSPVPPDFLARFIGPASIVSNGTNGIVFDHGRTYDRESGREVIRLWLDSFSVQDDRADAQFLFLGDSESVTEDLSLSQTNGQWTVTRMKELSHSYF